MKIDKKPSNIYGLKYLPTIGALDNHTEAKSLFGWLNVPKEISSQNVDLLKSSLLSLGDGCKCILEIGVDRNKKQSSTSVLLSNKKKHTIYLGVDIVDKSYLDNDKENIYTIKTSSFNRQLVIDKLQRVGCDKINLIFIDGNHSVNGIINDWHYVKLLSDHGIILLHDINVHPGPKLILDAIDETIFDKEKYFEVKNDWGMAKVTKI